VEDHHTGAASRGDVRELEGDVPTADKEDSFRQTLQFEKLLTRHGEFRARDLQMDRPGPCRHNDVARLQNIITNLNGCGSYETGPAVDSGNAPLNETLFAILWNTLDKGTLELHQPRPINLNLIGENPVFLHATIPIEEFCGADEHFLRIAAAQSAGASEWSRINCGNLLSGRAASHSHS
jgi:hypothetical protein